MADGLSGRLKACAAADLDVDGTIVTCHFGARHEGRRHAVRVFEEPTSIRFEATVLTRSGVRTLTDLGRDPTLFAWSLNRSSHLVGFRVDSRDRLIAEAMAPRSELTLEELRKYIRLVGNAADRMELVLTGSDAP